MAQPEPIKRNLVQAVGHLCSAAIDVPVAWLEEKAQAIRDRTKGRSVVVANVAQVAAIHASKDPEIVDRAVDEFTARLVRGQSNREAVARKAIDEFKRLGPGNLSADAVPADAGAAALDPDWLEMFAREAEKRSNEEMQTYFARLLAGEIRKPGTFSPVTIEVLARISPADANRFRRFCNVATEVKVGGTVVMDAAVYADPFGGNPGSNTLAPVGLSYMELTRLMDAGLIQHDLTAYRDVPPLIFVAAQLTIGGRSARATPAEAMREGQPVPQPFATKRRLSAINFTTAGIELRRLVDTEPPQAYLDKFTEWLAKHGLVLQLEPMTSRTSGDARAPTEG